MNVNRDVVTTITVLLTEEEAAKLGGLLAAVPSTDPFFETLAQQLDMTINSFLAMYKEEDGVYEQQEEI